MHILTYEFVEDVCSSLDSPVGSDDWVWLVDDDELDEFVDEFDDVVLDDGDCEITLGLWVTPITRTVGLPRVAAFKSIDGADAAPNTNGIVACVVPLTESTVMFGKPF